MTNRATIDEQAQIILGDKTSHGGVVVSGSPTSSWHGIPIVRKGDKVTCPKCKPHIFVVSEGFEHRLDFGLPMSVHGHKTSCGATLIAAGASTSSAAKEHNPPILFDEQIQFTTEEGKIIANTSYVLTLENTDKIYGITDENGKTNRFDTNLATKVIKVTFDLDENNQVEE